MLTVNKYQAKPIPTPTQRGRLEEVLADGGVRRMRDLAKEGITPATVRRAVADGIVAPVARGLYRLAGASCVSGQQLAEVAARVPNVIICLLSAAHFHGLLADEPEEVWGAIPNSQSTPRFDKPAFRPVRWRADAARKVGVAQHCIAGVEVAVTDITRTAIDMLRSTKSVGEAHALDCLRAALERCIPVEDFTAVAEALGVAKAV